MPLVHGARRVLLSLLALALVALAAPAVASATPAISITLDSADGQHYGVGKTATATVGYFDDATGAPITSTRLNYTIQGSGGTTAGTVTTDTNGGAQIQFTDNAIADDTLTVWDDSTTPNGSPDSGEPQDSTTATFWYGEVVLSPTSHQLTGAPATFEADIIGEDGQPVEGATLNWGVTGANADTGSATTGTATSGSPGAATITLNGTDPGAATLSATWDNPDAPSTEDPSTEVGFEWLATIQAPTSSAITSITVGPGLWCQATYNGDTDPEFFGHYSPASCGTYLRVDEGSSHVTFSSVDPISQTAVSGSGTSDDPYTLTTVAQLASTFPVTVDFTIRSVVTYVTGEDTYRTDVTVTDNSGAPHSITLAQYADCFLGNDDHGYGFRDPSSGGVYCTKQPNNSPADRIEGFIPLQAGFTNMEGEYQDVNTWMFDNDTFPSTCDCTVSPAEDNGMGLSWALSTPADGSVTRSFLTAFSPVGTVPAGDGAGLPPSTGGGGGGGGGSTSTSPSQTTTAPSQTPPAPARETTSPSANQAPAPPPAPEKTGNADPVSGTVLVRLPGTLRYVPIETVTSLPVGTIIDATHGVVALTVAIDLLGHTTTGQFTGGKFRFTQSLPKKGSKKLITNLRLAGGHWKSLCAGHAALRSAAWANIARRRVVRYLLAKAHGAFNVVGRDASGVERGTDWRTVDTCHTTEVHVRHGSVLVTDLVKHKKVVVKAPHAYVAHDAGGRRRRR